MNKTAVISISYQDLINPLFFKKNLLLFDKLVVVKETLEIARQLVDLRYRSKSFDDTNYLFNNQIIDSLEREGLLEFAKVNEPLSVDLKKYAGKSEEELDAVAVELKKITSEAKKLHDEIRLLVEKKSLVDIIPDLATTFPSNFVRLISIQLNFKGFEAYPLFHKETSYENMGKKEAVLKFVLKQLPDPDDNISLDNLLEFRKDPDTLAKYYALIKWVNEVAKKDFNIHEIQDEYRYLYHQYRQHFKIHNIKSKQVILEIFVTGAIDAFCGQLSVGNVSTSLFNLWKHHLNLLEAETNFAGREIAYIHKTEKAFQ
jgi:hypothetical protein